MADNVILPGTGTSVAADDVGGALYQRVKLAVGADGAAADLAPGQAAMAASLPVVIASNQSALPIGGSAADDAAAAGNPVPIGGVYQATADAVDDGDVGRLRMTARRAMLNAADNRIINLSAGDPAPSGTDITQWDNTPVEAADLDIRSADPRYIAIPMAVAGWRKLHLGFYATSAFDQAITMYVYNGSLFSQTRGYLAGITIPASSVKFSIDADAVGVGGNAGAATVTNEAHYSIPAFNGGAGYILLALSPVGVPTTGTLVISITRST